jgi:hypothetical protein
MTKYKTDDGYNTLDFLQFGIDHCQSSLVLFAISDPSYIDSAAYLMHLGLEQILKAWHLECFGEFTNTHSIMNLINKLEHNKHLSLTPEQKELIKKIDSYENIKYPRTNSSIIEVGNENYEQYMDLINNNILGKMPESIQKIRSNLNSTLKGGRILMEKDKI